MHLSHDVFTEFPKKIVCRTTNHPESPSGSRAQQCGTSTGMIPVYGVLLILFEWYWYVVCESGIRTSLILLARSVGKAPDLVSEGLGFDSRVGLSAILRVY